MLIGNPPLTFSDSEGKGLDDSPEGRAHTEQNMYVGYIGMGVTERGIRETE